MVRRALDPKGAIAVVLWSLGGAVVPGCTPTAVGRSDAGLSGGMPLDEDHTDGWDPSSADSEISAAADGAASDDGALETSDDGSSTGADAPTSSGSDGPLEGSSSGSDPTGPDTTDLESSDDGPIAEACPGAELGPTLPAVANGSNAESLDRLAGTCGAQGGLDVAFAFTAPADATYRFETTGSSYDTVLYVLDSDDCSGSVLACNDDSGGYQSALDVALEAGRGVVVVVDAYGPATGEFVLTVDEAPLP